MTAGALAALIDAHLGPLVLYARQFCAAPEDAVQTAFAALAALPMPPDHPKAWLFAAVRNAALDIHKRERRRGRPEAVAARPERWFDTPGPDADDAVRQLEALPPGPREAIVLRLWGGLTLEEVAAACSCSASTAHRRYEAGLAALRERLGVP